MYACNQCGEDTPVHKFTGTPHDKIDKELGYLSDELQVTPCPMNLPSYFIGEGGPMPSRVSAVFCSAQCSLDWHNKKENNWQKSTNPTT
jgi:hypothetical protein